MLDSSLSSLCSELNLLSLHGVGLCYAPGKASLPIDDNWRCLSTFDPPAGDHHPPQVPLGLKKRSSGHCCSPATSADGCSTFWASPAVGVH